MFDWKWKLRLFASADLVGSTAYKQVKATAEWARTFREFFKDFPDAVESAYNNVPQKCSTCTQKLSPWKFSGDEILFNTQLCDHKEVATHIAAFKHAVVKFPIAWKQKGVPLGLKATAWIAGFPVGNSELEIGDGLPTDFIGPAIDLGFRITQFASERRFIVSADLALLLLDAVHTLECDHDDFRLHLLRREPLKGVINNKPYPIVWLDPLDGELDVEEELLGITRTHKPQVLAKFLRQFIDDHSPPLLRPFIEGDGGTKYNAIPQKHLDLRDKMRAEESSRGYSSATAAEAAEGEDVHFKPPIIHEQATTQSETAE